MRVVRGVLVARVSVRMHVSVTLLRFIHSLNLGPLRCIIRSVDGDPVKVAPE